MCTVRTSTHVRAYLYACTYETRCLSPSSVTSSSVSSGQRALLTLPPLRTLPATPDRCSCCGFSPVYREDKCVLGVCVCMCMCVHAFLHVCICEYMRMHLCISTGLSVSLHACMYIYTHPNTSSHSLSLSLSHTITYTYTRMHTHTHTHPHGHSPTTPPA